MIAFGWSGPDRQSDPAVQENLAAIPRSLGLFAGHPADSLTLDHRLFVKLAGPRAKPTRGWQVPRSPQGWPVLFEGWLDNAAELARELGLPHGCTAEQVYGAAVERWGNRADARAIGCYAALVCLPDGAIRLARSPWSSFPLFYHASQALTLIASIPRPLFAAGLPKRLRRSELDALLRLDLPDEEHALYEGIDQVPQGSVVTLHGGVCKLERWYDPLSIPAIRMKTDADYTEAAEALLGEAVGTALAGSKRPGMTLSGGLDSPLVCTEVLRQLPPEQRLPSFTFVPLPQFDGIVPPHKFGDDRPWVEAFAAMHPRLDPQFIDNAGIGFDDRAEAMFLSCDAGYPARVSGSVYHGVYDAARAAGCDLLLLADSGNFTLSTLAPWAAREFARSGQWRQLWRLGQANLADPRPPWRRLPQDLVMLNLRAPLADRLRAAFGRPRQAGRYANPFLRGAKPAAGREGGGITNAGAGGSRGRFIQSHYRSCGAGNEMAHSFDQVFGIRARDALAYRPLIEFCMGLPTSQFVRDGETRRLARELGRGRIPEAQRRNRLYGGHNVDWHARMTPRLPELRAQVQAIADNPELAEAIDCDALIAALDSWPEQTPRDQALVDRYQFMLPAVLYIARFVDFTTGRNQR